MHKARLHGVSGERELHEEHSCFSAARDAGGGYRYRRGDRGHSGIATADSSSTGCRRSTIFSRGGALSAADSTPALNLAISFDGMSLFQDGTAYAYSGPGGDIAIANGAGATAYAFGTNNYASVDGTDSHAVAGGYSDAAAGTSSDNTAFVFGDNSTGLAGTTDPANPGSFNYAVIFGDNDGALAGGNGVGAGSYDGAYVEGNRPRDSKSARR